MNSTNHIGRLTADPELRRTGDGTAVCTFTLAVRRPNTKDVSDFIDFVAWRQAAEYLSKYGHKGDIVAANGYLTSRKWKDKHDNNRINWEVTVESVELLSSRRESQAVTTPTQQQNNWQGGGNNAQQNFQKITDTDAKLPWEI